MHTQADVVIIGGGASGYFCAANLAELCPDLRVVILEKNSRVLQKVRVSGGGRCNVTHLCPEVKHLLKNYPRGNPEANAEMRAFGTDDTVEWFARRGVLIKAEPDGRMFPMTDDSETIIDCLERACRDGNVQVETGCEVVAIHPQPEGGFILDTKNGPGYQARYVCLATGGQPKLEQFGWIARLGFEVVPPLPSLFTFNLPGHPIRDLMGVSVPEAVVRLMGTPLKASGPVLVTHWGLSGPAVLRLSAFGARVLADMDYNYTIQVNWLPHWEQNELRAFLHQHRQQQGRRQISTQPEPWLPQRLWEFLVMECGINPDWQWGNLPAKNQNLLAEALCSYRLEAKGKTTYKEEFVTTGGVALNEVNMGTLQSKKHPGLYLAGEVLNVDGVTGGFNFQHAWASGIAVARHVAKTAQVLIPAQSLQ